MVEIRLGGKTRTLRYRTHEIAVLEQELSKAFERRVTITEILEKQDFGIAFLQIAILVGVAHEYVGKKGKAARLSRQLVGRWLDMCGEDGNADFDVVIATVIEAIVMGLPGARKAIADAEEVKRQEDAEDEADAEGAGNVSENPLTSTESEKT